MKINVKNLDELAVLLSGRAYSSLSVTVNGLIAPDSVEIFDNWMSMRRYHPQWRSGFEICPHAITALYADYVEYCREQKSPFMTRTMFSRRFRDLGFVPTRRALGVMYEIWIPRDLQNEE